MDILLTGHRGYVGTHLKPFLEEHGHEVTGADRKEMVENWKGFAYDIRTYEFDVVIHAGANADSQYNDPDIFTDNYRNALFIAEQVKAAPDVKLLFFSTCMAHEPTNWYAWSKRCAEIEIRTLLKPQSTIIRPFNIYGGNEPAHRKSLPRKLLDGEAKYLFKNYIRDFIHVNDVCRAIQNILKNSRWGRIYDVGTGIGTTPFELFEIAGNVDNEAQVVHPDDILKFESPKRLVANPDLMLKDAKPEVELESWLKKEVKNGKRVA